MQSLHFPIYAEQTEADILIELINRESIIDYREVEWQALTHHVTPVKQLQQFVGKIFPRTEKVRVLAFFRDNARDLFFDKQRTPELTKYETECARIIHQNLEDSKRDQFHGAFAEMPRPNLRLLAQGYEFHYKLSEEDKVIDKHLPSYPHNIGAFPNDMIIYVAHECYDWFMACANKFELTKEKKDQPRMAQKDYIQPIRNRLMFLANRYMYFEEEPAYQVLWVMGVLMRLPHKSNWWRERFAEGIVDYLNLTRDFPNSKPQIQRTVREIRKLTEQQLPFDCEEDTETQTPARSANHSSAHSKALVEGLAEMLQQVNKAPKQAPATSIPYNAIFCAELHIGENRAPITSIENSDVTINPK